jgi:hypothetical protein
MAKVKKAASPAGSAEGGEPSKKKLKKIATAAAATPAEKPKTDKQLYTELVQDQIESLKAQGKITTDTATCKFSITVSCDIQNILTQSSGRGPMGGNHGTRSCAQSEVSGDHAKCTRPGLDHPQQTLVRGHRSPSALETL